MNGSAKITKWLEFHSWLWFPQIDLLVNYELSVVHRFMIHLFAHALSLYRPNIICHLEFKKIRSWLRISVHPNIVLIPWWWKHPNLGSSLYHIVQDIYTQCELFRDSCFSCGYFGILHILQYDAAQDIICGAANYHISWSQEYYSVI